MKPSAPEPTGQRRTETQAPAPGDDSIAILLSYLAMIAWVAFSLISALIHSLIAEDALGIAVFHLSEVAAVAAVVWLIRRDRVWARGAATALVFGNVLAWLGFGGSLAMPVLGAGVVFVLLMWVQPEHHRAARLDQSLVLPVLAVCAALVLVDVAVITDSVDAAIRDDACLLWCE